MFKHAAMDVGTNSCRLLLATIEDGQIISEMREVVTTRIGKGLAASGQLDAEGMEKSLACLSKWSALLLQQGVISYQLVGTSAMREATNGVEFAHQVKAATGLDLRIITGEEEAELSYAGVRRGLNTVDPPLVVDLGGGSTEFICYDKKSTLRLSLPLGAVRAFDMNWQEADYWDLLKPLADYINQVTSNPLVMVGGTATTLAAIDLRMEKYDWQQIQGHHLSRARVEELYQELTGLSLKERKGLPGLLPERADIIPYGAAIIISIMKLLARTELIVADTDLLTALLWVG